MEGKSKVFSAKLQQHRQKAKPSNQDTRIYQGKIEVEHGMEDLQNMYKTHKINTI
jgi:hypothetical protein